jgi:hypothetical protein
MLLSKVKGSRIRDGCRWWEQRWRVRCLLWLRKRRWQRTSRSKWIKKTFQPQQKLYFDTVLAGVKGIGFMDCVVGFWIFFWSEGLQIWCFIRVKRASNWIGDLHYLNKTFNCKISSGCSIDLLLSFV